MNSVEVSIIIPTFNNCLLISRAIESVLAQRGVVIEIIVIDDGSTDETRKVVAAFGAKIKYFYQENKGVSAARNVGVRESVGKYIVFLDSDDFLFSNSISKRKKMLDDNNQVGLVFTDYRIARSGDSSDDAVLARNGFLKCFENEILRKQGREIIFNNRFLWQYFNFTPLPIWTGTVMIRRNVISQLGMFREDYFTCEDTEYWIRVLQKFTVGFIDESLSCYNHSQSTLTRGIEKYGVNAIRLYHEILATIPNKRIRRGIRRRISQYQFYLGEYYRQKTILTTSMWYYLASSISWPLQRQSYCGVAKAVFQLTSTLKRK